MLYSHTKNYLLCLASYTIQLFIRRNYNHFNKTLLLCLYSKLRDTVGDHIEQLRIFTVYSLYVIEIVKLC